MAAFPVATREDHIGAVSQRSIETPAIEVGLTEVVTELVPDLLEQRVLVPAATELVDRCPLACVPHTLNDSCLAELLQSRSKLIHLRRQQKPDHATVASVAIRAVVEMLLVQMKHLLEGHDAIHSVEALQERGEQV
jgi:hypothetical protein